MKDISVLKSGRKCLFCGAPANSREHVIAEWLSKRMEIRGLDFGTESVSEEFGVKTRPATTAHNFRTRQVCESCNGGWMSALEVWFQKRLGFLVEPSWPVLAPEMIQCLREEGDSLMRWMIKSAVVFEQVVPRNQKQVVPEEVRVMAKNGVTTNDFSLMLGKIAASGFTAHLVKGFPVWNGGVLHDYQEHRNGFAFGVYLNYLAIRLVRCPGGSPSVKSPVFRADGAPVVPFWISPPMKYEEPVSHEFPTFEAFLDTLEVRALEGSQ